MDLRPLYDVQERLEQAAVAGTGLLGEDFRLKRAMGDLAPLATASPVFGRIRAALEELLSAPPEGRGGMLLDALALVDAVAYTQAAVGVPGELEPLPPGAGTCQDVSYSQLHPLLEALTGTGGGRMAVVQEALQAHPEYFSDYRVLPALVKGLGDSYGELADLNAAILSRQGPGIAPLLKEGFDPAGGRAMARRVEAMAQAAGAGANGFYLAQLPLAKREVRLALIDALSCDPANTALLLELCQTERKGEALSRARCALIRLDTPEAEAYLAELCRTAPDEMLEYLDQQSSRTAARLTAQMFGDVLDQMEANADPVVPQAVWMRLKRLCQVLEGKTGPEIGALASRLADLTPQQLDRKVEGTEGRPVVMRFACFNGHVQGSLRLLAALSLCSTIKTTGDGDLCRLVIQLQQQAGDDLLAPALAARLITQAPKDSYTWAEAQLVHTGLLGAKVRQEAVFPFQTALGLLSWDDQAGVYRYHTRGSGWKGGTVTVPPLDQRWFTLLIRAGRQMDHILMILLSGRTIPDLPRQVLVHLYHSAVKSDDYGQTRGLVELLSGLGWTDWDGFAVKWLQKSGQVSASWEILHLLERLPVSSREKAGQLQQIHRLVREARIKVRDRRWPEEEIQARLDAWRQADQTEGGNDDG